MKKSTLTQSVTNRKMTTKEALQLLWDNVNKGQKKQILKNSDVKAMLDLYTVDYED